MLAFWQGYLTKRATPDGYVYASVNDCFMERCGLTTDGRGPYGIYDPTRLNVNPIQTVAMLRYVLEGAIDMGSALGLGAAELPQYRDILRHLPPLPTAPLPKPHAFANATRVFVGAESAAPSPPGSNPVETSALFPGASIGLSSDPSLLQTAQATVLWLDSFATGNSFPQIFAAAGRVAPPSGPLNASFVQRRFLQRLHGDSAPSFYVHQFGGGVETVGALAYVNEMLLQSHEGFIRLFPGIALGQRASFRGLLSPLAMKLSDPPLCLSVARGCSVWWIEALQLGWSMPWYSCGVVWCGVVWCGVVWCGVVWCGVVWCGVVWCGVVWCGVVWCGVPKALLPNGKRPGCLPKGKGKRAGLCVLCARCVEVCCCIAGPVHSRTWPTLPCRRLCAVTQGLIGPLQPTCHAARQWQWAVDLLLCTVPLPGGSGQCNSCYALLHCPRAVGSATPAMHCLTAWGQWAVELPQCTAPLPGGSGQRNSCNALPHCPGEVGTATPAMHCLNALGQ